MTKYDARENKSQKIKIKEPDLDMPNISNICNQVINLFDKKIKKITLELENVNFIDSEGIWGLYEIHIKANKIGSKIQLINITPEIKKILKKTGLSNKLNILYLSHSL